MNHHPAVAPGARTVLVALGTFAVTEAAALSAAQWLAPGIGAWASAAVTAAGTLAIAAVFAHRRGFPSLWAVAGGFAVMALSMPLALSSIGAWRSHGLRWSWMLPWLVMVYGLGLTQRRRRPA
jgi:hypothetical protein